MTTRDFEPEETYGYRHEREGWEVWLLSTYTHDRRELVGTFRSERQAQAAIRRLERRDKEQRA
jgi:hypothetical protein